MNIMATDLNKLAGKPDSSLRHEVSRLGDKQLRRIVKLASKEDQTSTDSIHDMRVASRRLRELVKIQLQVEKSKSLKKMYRFARDLGRQLGAVRSDDVLIEALEKLGAENPIRVLRLAVSMRRREKVQRLEMLLRSDAFENWVDHAKREFDHTNKGGPTVKESMRHIVEAGREEVQAYHDVHADSEFSRLHQLRIDAKHLRYRLEFFSQVPGVSARAAIQQLTDLQDHLGDLHDKILLLKEIEAAQDPAYGWTREELSFLATVRTRIKEEIGTQRRESPAKWQFAFEEQFLSH